MTTFQDILVQAHNDYLSDGGSNEYEEWEHDIGDEGIVELFNEYYSNLSIRDKARVIYSINYE